MMKQLITFLFIASLCVTGFLALNYLCAWIYIDYGNVVKVAITILVLTLVVTGLAMVQSTVKSGQRTNQPHVGKKDDINEH